VYCGSFCTTNYKKDLQKIFNMDEIRRSLNGWVDNVEGEEYQINDPGIVR
jgi:hypothetical protein